MVLNREQILKAQDIKTEEVEVPEWGGTVKVRVLTGEARQQFQQLLNAPKGKLPKNVLEALLIVAVVDDTGEPLFSAEDIEALSKKSSVALQRVWDRAAEINGLTDRAIEKRMGE